ncbi:unnamed protein product [Caenorhabditis bovis]|uniref:Uncharacterized protein n=1 Tax=Caenorhabditis bovis TaxID=2654633 RepID=A0A8S1EVF7_9PELO|nr:unnamed protein product [Caenorhabditis bovis]
MSCLHLIVLIAAVAEARLIENRQQLDDFIENANLRAGPKRILKAAAEENLIKLPIDIDSLLASFVQLFSSNFIKLPNFFGPFDSRIFG